MTYVIDDTSGFTVGTPVEEKKFPWGAILAGLPAVLSMVTKK